MQTLPEATLGILGRLPVLVFSFGLLALMNGILKAPGYSSRVAATVWVELERRVCISVKVRSFKVHKGGRVLLFAITPLAFGLCFSTWLGATKVYAQTANTSPSFEVASIYPDHSNTSDWSMKATQSAWNCKNTPLEALLWAAFKIKDFQVVSAPGWVHSERYTIEATFSEEFQQLPEARKSAQVGPMLQALLAERFHLRYHWITRQTTVYALVTARGGAKLGAATPDENGSAIEYDTFMQVHGYSMGDFAKQLSATLKQTVEDKTGLNGRYSFTLHYPPLQDSQGATGAGENAEAEKQVRIYSSLQEQLGLKLEARKGPVAMLVVDGIDRPTPN